MARFYIGTSGWQYDNWKGHFYPEDLAKTKWLEYYVSQFNTIEVNNTFYRMPSEKSVAAWAGMAPSGFTFAVKASRFITHIKRLRNTGDSVDTFVKRVKGLGKSLGPVLYQLPQTMKRDDERLDAFLRELPKKVQHVVEFREASWLKPPVFAILRKYGVGFCVFDSPELSSPVLATAKFAYIRFHGKKSLFSSEYTDEEMVSWAKKLTRMGRRLDAIYVYFNNDVGAAAVRNAMTLRKLLAD